ncbi:HAD family hydrolase [Erythrobacter sp. NE805]|uniref:HAD family hydrolase n=1 Tax=Erythrobacter sp. NE805 TaxID=3389875 RepID=UPI00396B3E1C
MKEIILPHQLPEALLRSPAGITMLSLDCFDTLLWRDCHQPTDVFAALPGLLIQQRVSGEIRARKAKSKIREAVEVTLADIYAEVMPFADQAARDRAIAAELEAEARACFAFAPTVELMRVAKAQGLDVVIVSDTYLSSDQLRELIAAAAGPEVVGLIDRIFASSDHGISKGQGLIKVALEAMQKAPDEVLHIGDNPRADFQSARRLGVHALHLLQFADPAARRLRHERACARMDVREQGSIEPRIVGLQPHRALLAALEPRIDDPAEALGATVLGPVFTAFDDWLRAEAEALQQARGGTVHWLFCLRDGHLPEVVHAARGSAPSTARAEISRFVATAASLVSAEGYQRQVGALRGMKPTIIARQMLLEEGEMARILGSIRNMTDQARAVAALDKELHARHRRKRTMQRAERYADRLVAHVRAVCNPQPGDTLMLIDLGYNGSVQDHIDALLRERLGVHVAGRYLICREVAATGLDKSGLIDQRHFDPGVLEAMCMNVAVIEQLATCEIGSVIGYEANGTPIRGKSSIKGGQSDVRGRVQQGAVQFARAAQGGGPVLRQADAERARAWRDAAAQALLRFMFLPDPAELAILKSFEHDVNLGSDQMVKLFDPELATRQIKRRGLFYMRGSSRMFLPAELAQEDMSVRLALMVQQRFDPAFTYADYAPRKMSLRTFHLSADQQTAGDVEAHHTHDGYFVARIPLPRDCAAVGLQLGQDWSFVEIAEVTRSRIGSLAATLVDEVGKPCTNIIHDAMREHAPGLFECLSESALMMIVPDADSRLDIPGSEMIEVVFRPLAPRQRADEARLALAPLASKDAA